MAHVLNVVKPLCDRTPDEKPKAEKNHQKTHAALKRLLKLKENRTCADCEAGFPGWAVLPHGIFVCINCAQVHRGIGRHISQVKAVTTGTYLWYPDEFAAMERTGNARANACFAGEDAPPKPAAEAPQFQKENYIRAKYEKRQWFIEPAEAAEAVERTGSSGGVAPGIQRTASGKVVNAHCTKCGQGYHSSSGQSPLCPRCRPVDAPGAAPREERPSRRSRGAAAEPKLEDLLAMDVGTLKQKRRDYGAVGVLIDL